MECVCRSFVFFSYYHRYLICCSLCVSLLSTGEPYALGA